MSNNDEAPICPICCDALDATDLNFYPCQCNYQICLWCYNRISEGVNPVCPACRTPYDKSKVHEQPDKKVVEQAREEQRQKRIEKQREQRQEKEKRPPTTAISGPPPALAEQLANVKVRQRNLVYVTGIPVQECQREVLSRNSWFGRFGRIISCVTKNDTAYITYQKATDAEAAITGMHGRPTSDGRALRCAVGTTKYCSFFLRRQECPNPHCLYLHEIARSEDTYYEEVEFGEETSPAYNDTPDSPMRTGYNTPKQVAMVRNASAPSTSLHRSQSHTTQHPNSPHSLQNSTNSKARTPGLKVRSSVVAPTRLSRAVSVPTLANKAPRMRAPPGFSSHSHDNSHTTKSSRETSASNTPSLSNTPSHGQGRSHELTSHANTASWPPMPNTSMSKETVMPKVVRGVVYADELPHEKKRRSTTPISRSNDNFGLGSSGKMDLKSILNSLMTEDMKLIPFANLAAVTYTSESVLKNLPKRLHSRFAFAAQSGDQKDIYNNHHSSDSVIQKLLNSSSNSLYGVFK